MIFSNIILVFPFLLGASALQEDGHFKPKKLVRHSEQLQVDPDGSVSEDTKPSRSDAYEVEIGEHGDTKLIEIESALQQRSEQGMVAKGSITYTEYEKACAAHYNKVMSDKDNVVKVVETAMMAIVKTVPLFIAKPTPKIMEALNIYKVDLWTIITLLVPADKQQTQQFIDGKAQWDSSFNAANKIAGQIKEFKDTGEQYKLVVSVIDIITEALNIARIFWPQGETVFGSIIDIITGVGESWQDFEEGDWSQGVDVLYKAIRGAIEELVPADQKNTDTYAYVITALDATIGQLHKTVFEFKRLMLEARVCYKLPKRRRRKVEKNEGKPDKCDQGYELAWDGNCLPPKDEGRPCMDDCGRAGKCDWCGAGKACCRRYWKDDPCECPQAAGYTTNHKTKGNPNDYWQCVAAVPCIQQGNKCVQSSSLAAMNVSESTQDAFDISSLDGAVEKKRKKSKPKPTPKPTKDRSQCQGASLLQAKEKSDQSRRSKHYFEENVNKLSMSMSASRGSVVEQEGSLDRTVSRKVGGTDSGKDNGGKPEERPGAIAASCSEGTKIGNKCYLDCDAGFIETKPGYTDCMQDCKQTGTHIYSGLIFCGKDPDAIINAWTEIGSMVMQTVLSVVQMCQDIKEEGFKPDHITKIVNTVIDMAKPLAKPKCNTTGPATGGTPEQSSAAGTFGLREQSDVAAHKQARQIFYHFDRNFDGVIDRTELKRAMTALDHNQVIDYDVMPGMDTDGDGVLALHEFIGWLETKHQLPTVEI